MFTNSFFKHTATAATAWHGMAHRARRRIVAVTAAVGAATASAVPASQHKQIEWVNKREKDSRKLYSSFMFVPSRTQTERIWVHDWTESERVGKKHVFIIIMTDKIRYRVRYTQYTVDTLYLFLIIIIYTHRLQ